jgi:hypothetical protein
MQQWFGNEINTVLKCLKRDIFSTLYIMKLSNDILTIIFFSDYSHDSSLLMYFRFGLVKLNTGRLSKNRWSYHDSLYTLYWNMYVGKLWAVCGDT